MKNQKNNTQNKTEVISRTTTIGEIVEKYPQTVEVLLTYGVHCVGCHVSPFESLEDGFRGHGLSEEKIDSAVIQLNEVVEKSVQPVTEQKVDGKITLSRLAVEKIKEFCEKNDKRALRIRVMPGGCSGYMYNLELFLHYFMKLNLLFLIFVFIFVLKQNAHAYIDPGVGGIIIQAIIGGLAAVSIFFGNIKKKLKKIFKFKNKNEIQKD